MKCKYLPSEAKRIVEELDRKEEMLWIQIDMQGAYRTIEKDIERNARASIIDTPRCQQLSDNLCKEGWAAYVAKDYKGIDVVVVDFYSGN